MKVGSHRILVTGGAGFIGSNLIHYILSEAEEDVGISVERVVTLDKLTYAGNRENLNDFESDDRHRFVVGDICDTALVANLLRKEKINLIIHLAAESHVDRSIDSSAEFIRTNIVGTHTLLEAARSWAQDLGQPDHSELADVRPLRFLHVSTDEVYGSLPESGIAFSETTPFSPNSPYAASKAGSDHLTRAWYRTYGLPTITINCSNNYGPFQFPEKFIPLMLNQLRRGEPLPIYGDGSNIRDWLYVRDHCRALVLAAVHGTPGEKYLVGGNCEMSNLDVAHALVETTSRLDSRLRDIRTKDLITFVPDRPGHDWRYAIDSSKIRNELGWEPRENFSSGLEKTIRWYLENENWIRNIENRTPIGDRLGRL